MWYLYTFAIIPLLLAHPILQAQHADTFTTSYKNRIVTVCSVHTDTTYHQALDSGEEQYSMFIQALEKPILLSGEKIYSSDDVSMPVQLDKLQGNVKNFIRDLLSQEISQMDEFGELQIVIDEEGKLAYLHVYGLNKDSVNIEKAITKKIEAVHFIPAQRNGNLVPYYFEITK